MSSLKHKDQIDPEADTGHQNFGFQNEKEGHATGEDTNHSNTQELVVDDLIHKDVDGNENDSFVLDAKTPLIPFIKNLHILFQRQCKKKYPKGVE